MSVRKRARSFAELVRGRDPMEFDRALHRGLEALTMRESTILVRLLDGYRPKAPTVARAPWPRLEDLGLVELMPQTCGARLTGPGRVMAIHAREFAPMRPPGSVPWVELKRIMTPRQRRELEERAREILENPIEGAGKREVGWPEEGWSIMVYRDRDAGRRLLGIVTNPRRKPKPLPWKT